MNEKKVDMDREYMMKMWGTSRLVTEYGSLSNTPKQKALDFQRKLIERYMNEFDVKDET